ncbi:hypothetical protein BSKO_11428 [Bryopsis sp. KO-2023]|nr:hypothetical protein BSKO_11428 [Bryopsis sp. KO-2023]
MLLRTLGSKGLWTVHKSRLSFARSIQAMRPVRMAAGNECIESPQPRGAFILFEGVDHSGKTTQAKRLAQALNDRDVNAEFWNFPDRNTGLGKIITSYLSGTTDCEPDMVHLLFAANRMEKRASLLEKLRSGVTIVMDRYCYSGAAFTMAKNLPGLDAEWCKSVERGKLPEPDLTYFLDLSVEVAEKRAGFGSERYERREFQQEVRSAFHNLSKSEDWEFIDGAGDPEEIHEKIFNQSLKFVEECRKKGHDLGQIWAGKLKQ